MTIPPITSLLVANRGEIARRVFRSAQAMGMRTIAVYVDADTHAPFVTEADEAVRLEGGYLDMGSLIAAAERTGADAIHPGYGFLSENAGFAQAVLDAGMIWVGPTPHTIASMGDKLAAKRLAIEAGVPVLASADDPADAPSVGFPLLVKAAAGGGGKGMRLVNSPDELDDAVAAARREALAGFGDDTVFFERYVARARHVEIQILGDHHGGLVHLGERECSIQRRHQKIIEEAPSPAVGPELRAAMGAAALRLAAAIGYRSAGTVEFVLDADTGEFSFLEVNTRLQVEHPVTEAVTGIDLVRAQLRIAAGEPLWFDQDDVRIQGHAVEARLYAEDPSVGFLPATGTLVAWKPASEPAVRWDSGVEAGSVVGLDFDPMLAKVIAHAPTRAEATARLALALERLHVGGVVTNDAFLARTLRHPAFVGGDTTTDFIERVAPGSGAPEPAMLRRAAIVAAMWLQGHNRVEAAVLGAVPSGWRNARLPRQEVRFTGGGVELSVRYAARRDGAFDVDDGVVARVVSWSPDAVDVEIDGVRARCLVTAAGDVVVVGLPGGSVDLKVLPRFVPPAPVTPGGGLVAPMPGRVIEVRVAAGDHVVAGQLLVVLEAMKMEHRFEAPADGTVDEVRVDVGDQVDTGQVLLVMADPAGATHGGAEP